MRLVSFQASTGPATGILRGDEVVPLSQRYTPATLVESWDSLAGELSQYETAPGIPLKSLTLLAPVAPKRNLLCIGWNYLAHFEEGKPQRGDQAAQQIPDHPTLFSKATHCVTGPYDDLPQHEAITAKLDWEVELAVVIGRAGVDIPEAKALEHVFGYMVANDVSARDLQKQHGGQWFKGKSLDRTCPLGPVLITADEIAIPQALEITCRVNGVVKQHANTRQQVFGVARLIAILSQGMTLIPGDIILTGTPEGVGNSRIPPEYLQAGDIMETEIAGLGILRNRIVSATAVP